MKALSKRIVAIICAVLMIFSVVPTGMVYAAETEEAEETATTSYEWKSITFGQSTDLNFKSTIAEDKVGVNESTEKQITVQSSDGEETTKDAVEIESRGGKIANTHDGLTFYYTKIPTDQNFTISAKVFLNQLGPEESTGSSPSKQEAAGVMVRDCIGEARQNPMVFGYEELPAASNIVSNMLLASAKTQYAAVTSNSYDRNGVTAPYGNTGTTKTSTKLATLSDVVATTDYTPTDGVYDEDDFVTLTLQRTNEGFVISYTDSDGTTSSKTISGADRVAVVDEDYMYVGFFASRNAKITVTDIDLTTSDADTVEEGYTATPYEAVLDTCSAATSSTSDYTVRLRSNYNGTVTIKQDGETIADGESATAATFYEKQTTLTNDTTEFEVSYVTDDASNTVKTDTFTVTKNETYAKKDLYVSTDGTSAGEGTLDSPLDLKTALGYISDGYTIYAKGGTYDALVMDTTYTADATKKKTLTAYNDETVIISGTSQVDASNWYFKGLEFTGSSTTGFRLTGHNNTLELCKFYDNGDTGCQISGGSGTDPLTWPTNNYVLNCESYNNVDDSRINADGFAAKLGVGTGNVFRGCISHNNADDGWDLYNKLEDGANEPVTIDSCISYENGIPLEGEKAEEGSIGNGFKLGGEGYPVNHIVTNCIAYDNNMDGFTCNFNPGQITVTNCTSYDNARCNYIFRSNPYRTASEQGIFTNDISYRSDLSHETSDYISGNTYNSFFFADGVTEVTASDFVSLTLPTSYERDTDGNIIYGNFLRLTTESALNTAGKEGTYVGALSSVQPTYTVTFDANGGTSTVASSTYSSESQLTSLPTPTRAGYTFAGWYTEKTGGTEVTTDLLNATTQDSTVYAHWNANSYTVTFNANGGSCSKKSATFTAESQLTSLPTPTRTGYTFAGWYTKKSGGTKVTVSSINAGLANVTVYAHWTAKSYKVTFNANGGTCSKTSATFTADSALTSLPTATRTGYTFAGWYTKKSGGTKVTAKTVSSALKNQTVYAHWTAKTYTVTLNANGGYIGKTSVKTKATKVTYKGTYKLTTPKRAGYTFAGWYTKKSGGSKVTSSTKVTITKNTTLYAHWTKVSVKASKVASVTNKKTKKAVVSVKKVSGAAGYQVRYSTKSSLKSAKTVTSKSNSITLSKLTKNKTYYVQVRSFKYDSTGKKVYSSWSASKKVTIKK